MDWTPIAPGIYRAVFGSPEEANPLRLLDARPRTDALAALGDAPLPAAADGARGAVPGARVVIHLPLEEDEALHGLGLQLMRVNQRGHNRYLRVCSDPLQDTGETHAPVPFYVSSRGYGILANTARIVTMRCGSSGLRDPQAEGLPTADAVEIVATAPGLELIAFAGPTPLEAVQRYNLFCGGGCLPPRWGLGFWHRVPTDYTAEQVKAEAREFRERGIPCDVIGLEPGWQTRSYPCSFEWEHKRFPDPQAFVAGMAQEGFRINLWEHAYVSPDAPLHPALAPYSGSHTVWGGLAPDYTLPEAQSILKEQHAREHVDRGVSGYKLDECDGGELKGESWMFPAHAAFPSGLDGEQMRQVFGLLLQRMTESLYRERDRRTYGLVRASGAGAPPLPYVLYSDLYDHRQFVRALCNSGFSGLLWTPEIRSARDAEDWVRRMQTVCLSPLAMLNAWMDGTKPWSYEEVEPIVRETIQLRMRLMPYLYSAFARYHFEGVPPFRAMALEMEGAEDVDDQYMVGDSLLVAPLFAGERHREVLLPPGAWFDFETGERLEGGRAVRVFPGLDRLPLYVRDGGIIPLMEKRGFAPRAGETVALEIRCYGSARGTFRLYDDDGETFAYERGAFCWRAIETDGAGGGALAPAPDGWPSSYGEVTWRWYPG